MSRYENRRKHYRCHNCGTIVGLQDRFCVNCGSRVRKRSIGPLVGVVVILVILLIATAVTRPLPQPYTPTTETSQSSFTSVPAPYIQLRAEVDESGYWTRSDADLPLYNCSVVFRVYNEGTKTAENVVITTLMDGRQMLYPLTISIDPRNQWNLTIVLFLISYDEPEMPHQVSLAASHRESSDATSIWFTVGGLPRRSLDYWNPEVAKLFITPNNVVVKNLLKEISRSYAEEPMWMAIQNWVEDNIRYANDSQVYGGDYWQLPRETIRIRSGDCEDCAVLMVSLYRAAGYDAERVFVITGTSEAGGGHAWVRVEINETYKGVYYGQIEWLPTPGGIIFTPKYAFNDVYFYDLHAD